MTATTTPRSAYWQACRHPAVWARALRIGLVVGVIQVSLNQGDHWITGHVTTGVVIKTILSPLLSFAVAFASAVATHAENVRRSSS